MRPLQLTFSGMRSYPGTCGPLDFTGKNLIGILGDTGAGKSTILEAITFALYGNCSWSGQEVEPLVADGANAMEVDFTFAHNGQRWRVHRTFHTNTTPSLHLLENLDDPDEHFDGRRAVDRKIVSLLKLHFDSFQAAVLLPQGRFDRLLTASGRERTELLKGIFGTQVIETMRDQVAQHREHLKDLIHEAELARKPLLADPAATAAQLRDAADEEDRKAKRLADTLTTLRALQKQTIVARARSTELGDLLVELTGRQIHDAPEVIGRTEPIERDLATRETDLKAVKTAANRQLADAKQKLTAAADKGYTTESLSAASTVLCDVSERVSDLVDERNRLERQQWQITEQDEQLKAIETNIAALQATLTKLAEASKNATTKATEANNTLTKVRDKVGAALGEAVNLARALQDQLEAERRIQPLQKALPPLQKAVIQADHDLQAAGDHVDELRRNEAAHTVGADLAAGDTCPVCEQQLPTHYRPPEPLDQQALDSAERAKKRRTTQQQQANQKLSQARSKLESAQDAHQQRQQATGHARARLEQACQAALDAAAAEIWHQGVGEVPPMDLTEFAAALDSATAELVSNDQQDDDKRAEMLTQVLKPMHALERALAQAAGTAEHSAQKAHAEVEKANQALATKRETNERAAKTLSQDRRRHTTAKQRLNRDLQTLPGATAQELPADVLSITDDHVKAVRDTLARLRGRVNELINLRNRATEELAKIAEDQRALDQRRAREVTQPLQSLVTGLNRWKETIERIAQTPEIDHHAAPPSAPEDLTTALVGSYADALAQTASAQKTALQAISENAEARAEKLMEQLQAHADTLAGETGPDGAITLGDGDGLLENDALDPLNSAMTITRDRARQLRAEQGEAEGQIERAATLDAALNAGRARYQAVDVLRSLLAEAKFQRYLTDRRTRALLGLASRLFGQLSGGQYGFAEDFRIVSRRTRVTRSPKTLSGGETFLASLALALALVELYSRSGARLGALFLDEGFGSLDVDTLATALTVLRSETGGDKLVTVISHLHPVAEAVEDVLWVERGPAGSEARWLDANQRDALVRQDVSAGLLNLA